MMRRLSPGSWLLIGLAALLALVPLVVEGFFVEFVLSRMMILGVAAATLIFLSRYAGLVSMAQWVIAGIAAFAVGNLAGGQGTKGLKLEWNPWAAMIVAIVVATLVALLLGALSSRTTGIYYLMLTFVYAVIGAEFFQQVKSLSGSTGITGIDPPASLSRIDHPVRIYYLGLVLSVLVYVLFRAFGRTPFGLALQGTRDDPVRMEALGYNVALHRTLAFGLAGFAASFAGVLNIWWNGQIAPTGVGIGPSIDLLIVAVIGGITRLEGAWIGAFIFVAANSYLRSIPIVNEIIPEERFNTVIGLIVLLIVVLSPDGITGIVDRLRGLPGQIDRGRERRPDQVPIKEPGSRATPS